MPQKRFARDLMIQFDKKSLGIAEITSAE